MKDGSKKTEINLLDIVKKAIQLCWIWILTTIAGGFVGFFGTMYANEVLYEATTMLYVNNSSSISSAISSITSLSTYDMSASRSAVALYCIMIKTRTCLNKVDSQIRNREGEAKAKYESIFGGKDNLENSIHTWHPKWSAIGQSDWAYNYNYIAAKTEVASIDSTEIFGITITSPYPQEAILLSNVVADVAKDYISTIINGTSVKIVDEAHVAVQLPRGRAKNAVVGAAVGAVLGLSVVVLIYFLHDEIESAKWFEETYNEFPVLATIPDASEDSSKYGYYKYNKYGYGYGVSKGYYGSKISDKTANDNSKKGGK